MNFYNENNKKAAAWLRQLIADRLIPDGIVDERSIVDVRPADLVGFTQLHFFAGIAGWSRALELAGWPADRSCVSASLPCQPFSAAGKQLGHADERHLWPVFLDLVRGCRHLEPFQQLFGEQVEAAVRLGWLDGVFADLAGEGYACGNSVLGAHSVGAPHIRQRIFWGAYRVGVANGAGWNAREQTASSSGYGSAAESAGGNDGVADANKSELRRQPSAGEQSVHEQSSGVGGLEHTARDGREQWGAEPSGRGVACRCSDDGLADSKGARSPHGGTGRILAESREGFRTGGLAHPTGEQVDTSDARGLHAESCGCGGSCGGVENAGPQRTGWRLLGPGESVEAIGERPSGESRGPGGAVGVGDTDEPRSQGWEFGGNGADQRITRPPSVGHWYGCELIQCADGKARRTPKPESRILRLDDGFFYRLDSVVSEIAKEAIKEVEEYATRTGTSPEEVLRMVRDRIRADEICANQEETVGEIGGAVELQKEKILYDQMWSLLAAPKQSAINSCGIPETGASLQSWELRDLRAKIQTEYSSLRRKSDEQREGESSDPLSVLSQFLARCCEKSVYFSRRSNAAAFPLCEPVKGRVDMLRGFGNAICPQVAAEFIQAFIEAKETLRPAETILK